MKDKVLKVLFIISFLPCVLALLFSIKGAFWGTRFWYDTIYGTDAFWINLISVLSGFMPIFLICFAFQIYYIFKNVKGY